MVNYVTVGVEPCESGHAVFSTRRNRFHPDCCSVSFTKDEKVARGVALRKFKEN